LFGRHERSLVAAYRSLFVDLDMFVSSVRDRVAQPDRILEIGCGDGAISERLAATFPNATVTGIDICERPGRLFVGDAARVRFLKTSAAELLRLDPEPYPLVVIADVLHHVPRPARVGFLTDAATLVGGGGVMVLKDWIRRPSLRYVLGYCSDRFVTGDRVHFFAANELRDLVRELFGADSIRSEFRVPPGPSNLALLIRPTAGAP
jgi:2-polyprenyl-6-hydroxyphenyl methylase/3-demethylubiquinone-9 3-methyltransferase